MQSSNNTNSNKITDQPVLEGGETEVDKTAIANPKASAEPAVADDKKEITDKTDDSDNDAKKLEKPKEDAKVPVEESKKDESASPSKKRTLD